MQKSIFILFLSAFLCIGCSSQMENNIPDDKAFTIDFFAMDTIMTITAYGPLGEDAVQAAVNEVKRIEQLFSTNIETSDIAMINQNKQQKVSAETIALLKTSIQLYNKTNGAFDIAVFPIVKAWGFTTGTQQIPSDELLADLLPHTDANNILLNESTLIVSIPPEMELGLGGIVKGYTSARIMNIFKEYGVQSGIVNLGGNVQVLGSKPDGAFWNIAIKNPLKTDTYIGAVSVKNQAVITSGAYERYFEADGAIYHHLIDPKTGCPANTTLASVTIIANDGTAADALTKLFVMGLEDASTYCRANADDLDAIFVTKDKKVYITEGLKDSFTLQAEDYQLEIIN